MTKSYSYIRLSTTEQKKGDSIRRQLQASKKFADKMGWELDDSLQDIGVSAYEGKHVKEGALGIFFDLCDAGEIQSGSVLIVENLDRISRQKPLDAVNLLTSILSRGISIAILDTEQVITEESVNDSVADLYMIVGGFIRAHEESARKSGLVRSAWSNKKKNASNIKITARCPAWLVLSADRKAFDIIPERQAIIMRIFNYLANGLGKYAITKILNSKNTPTFGGGQGWHSSYIQKLTDNESVLGTYQPYSRVNGNRIPDGSAVKNYYPAIIPEELFYQVRNAMAGRRTGGSGRKGRKFTNIFTGLAKCSVCKGSMNFYNKGAKPKGGQYLACAKARRGLCSNNKHYPYADIEKLILASLRELKIEDLVSDNQPKLRNLNSQFESISGKLLDLKRRRKNLIREFSDSIDKDIKDEIHDLGTKIDRCSKEAIKVRKTIKNETFTKHNVENALENFKALKMAEGISSDAEIYIIRAKISSEIKRVLAYINFDKRGGITMFAKDTERFYYLGKLAKPQDYLGGIETAEAIIRTVSRKNK